MSFKLGNNWGFEEEGINIKYVVSEEVINRN